MQIASVALCNVPPSADGSEPQWPAAKRKPSAWHGLCYAHGVTRTVSALLIPGLIRAATLCAMVGLGACATMERPRNALGSAYAVQQRDRDARPSPLQCHRAEAPSALAGLHQLPLSAFAQTADRLAPGDRLHLSVSGDKDQLTGDYVVAADGTVSVIDRISMRVSGETLAAVQDRLETMLIAQRLIRHLPNGVRLKLVALAGVPVAVSGAVFEAGTVIAGTRAAEAQSAVLSNQASGDQNVGRTVTAALRGAGGVRPDADPAAIYLMRGDAWARVDLSGAIDGAVVNDVAVTAGDRIYVGSTGCLQERLVRPTVITAPGVRVFLSNLSRPAASNAASAIGKDSTSLPYGTRFLQGLVSANCVGGSAMNAGRSAVLISRNPVTGQSVVIARSVERLVRGADRDGYDPYLMPGDAIACYDSAAMNVRDVIATISEAATPYVLFSRVR